MIIDTRNLSEQGDIMNIFRFKTNKEMNDRILRDIRNLFEHEEENYFKPVRVTIILNMKLNVIQINTISSVCNF